MAAPAKKPASRSTKRPQIAPQARALEWGFGVVSGLLVMTLLAYLVYEGARPQKPPSFDVTAERVERLGDGFHVVLQVANGGDATAAEVAVRGVLTVAGEVETSDTVLDFLPPRSNRKSVLIFRHDPAMGSLALSVRGYNAP
jgi:uncharacterized protein (TIGR02588 family)